MQKINLKIFYHEGYGSGYQLAIVKDMEPSETSEFRVSATVVEDYSTTNKLAFNYKYSFLKTCLYDMELDYFEMFSLREVLLRKLKK